MKFLRIPVLLIAFFIAACAHQADTIDNRLERQLVGMWMEYSPSSNLVSFDAGRQVKIFLKKGEIGNLKSLNGAWAARTAS